MARGQGAVPWPRGIPADRATVRSADPRSSREALNYFAGLVKKVGSEKTGRYTFKQP